MANYVPAHLSHVRHVWHHDEALPADLVQLLIEKGAAIDATDKDGWTPLHAACRQGNTNVVLLLVNAKASIVCRSRVRPAPHNFTQSDGATL